MFVGRLHEHTRMSYDTDVKMCGIRGSATTVLNTLKIIVAFPDL